MSPGAALEAMRRRWAPGTGPDPRDVAERAAVRLEACADPREYRVDTTAAVPGFDAATRIFVRELEGWRSMYVRALSDVDRFFDGARR